MGVRNKKDEARNKVEGGGERQPAATVHTSLCLTQTAASATQTNLGLTFSAIIDFGATPPYDSPASATTQLPSQSADGSSITRMPASGHISIDTAQTRIRNTHTGVQLLAEAHSSNTITINGCPASYACLQCSHIGGTHTGTHTHRQT